jgi:cobalt/nickel transport system permease protein
MSKTLQLGNEVFLAMQSRGFRGEVRLLTDFQLRARDYLALTGFAMAAAAAVVMGR